MRTQPIYIPLVKGVDLGKEPTLAIQELQHAENVDFSVIGRVKGRPSRAAAAGVHFRNGSGPLSYTALAAGGYSSFGTFSDGVNTHTFTPRGLLQYRDGSGEAVAMGCDGRLFALDQSQWLDRGPFHCARVDRVFNFYTGAVEDRAAIAQSFGVVTDPTPAVRTLTPDFRLQRTLSVNGGVNPVVGWGNHARYGTVNALVGRDASSNLTFLHQESQTPGSDTVYTTDLSSGDCPSTADDGDAPAICADYDVTNFWVAYCTSTANGWKLIRVTVSGGVATVTHTVTGTITGLNGIWVCNSPAADNRVLLALSHTTGVTVKVFQGTDLVDQAKDSSYVTTNPGRQVVIGWESAAKAWFCLGADSYAGGFGGVRRHVDLFIGTVNPGTASTAVLGRQYYGAADLTTAQVGTKWSIVHQPIKFGSRMYMTLVAGPPTGSSQNVGTWLTVDLSNWRIGSATDGGPFGRPSLVAQGPRFGTSPRPQPGSAVLTSDGTGWTFPTLDWERARLDSLEGDVAGVGVDNGLTRITMSGPRAIQAGGSTLFSGSVPHQLAGDDCSELGFPFMGGRPDVLALSAAGGTGALPNGSYTVTACWVTGDGAGQTHRSAPATASTVTVDNSSGNKKIQVHVSPPWLTERVNSAAHLEVYCTTENPTEDTPRYLQATTSVPSTTAAYTTIEITSVVTALGALYTDGGGFDHTPVSADGGLAVVGNRVWSAGGYVAYASLLRPSPRDGYAWNDAGALQVNLPAGAGRILSLENVDDKLVMLCERGIYVVQDGGPDNTNLGPVLPPPVRVSNIGVAGPRSSVVTEKGVVFCTRTNTEDPRRAGPWLLDRSMGVTYLGHPVASYFKTANAVPEVAYSPERQVAFITVKSGAGEAQYVTGTPVGTLSNDGVLALDMRTDAIAVWTASNASLGAIRSIEVVSGALWDLRDKPVGYTGSPGTDSDGGAYAMTLVTSHVQSTGAEGLGWGRVRGMRVLGTPGSGAHTLTMSAVLDGARSITDLARSVAAATSGTTWPSTQQAPEWRLPVQKCASLQASLVATPATAQWSAIRLDVTPLATAAPASRA